MAESDTVPKPSLAFIEDWRLAVPWKAVNWIMKAKDTTEMFLRMRHFSPAVSLTFSR